MSEQLALFDAEALNKGAEVRIVWNECDMPYIQKNHPQLLNGVGTVAGAKLGFVYVQIASTIISVEAKMVQLIQ